MRPTKTVDPLAHRRGLVRELAELRTTTAADVDRHDARLDELRRAVALTRDALNSAEYELAKFIDSAAEGIHAGETRAAVIRSELIATAPEALSAALGMLMIFSSDEAPRTRTDLIYELDAARLDVLDDDQVRDLLARAAARLPSAGIRVPTAVLS